VLLKEPLITENERLGQLIPLETEDGAHAPALQGQLLHLRTTSAYLLFAAFVASYNAARTDIKMVAVGKEETASGKTPKRSPKKSSPRKKAESQRLTGPKAFPLERMLAIFSCILPERKKGLAGSDRALSEVCAPSEGDDGLMGAQVADLVSSRLLIRVSKGSDDTSIEHLNGIKLKVNVEYSVVEALAQQHGFEIKDRMWDVE
jgi:origin recognition complex subunit 5